MENIIYENNLEENFKKIFLFQKLCDNKCSLRDNLRSLVYYTKVSNSYSNNIFTSVVSKFFSVECSNDEFKKEGRIECFKLDKLEIKYIHNTKTYYIKC